MLAPLRSYGTPLLDDIRPQPYVDIQRIIEPLFPPGRLNYWKANFVDELSDDLVDVLVEAMTRVPSPYTLIAIEPMGGAISRVPPTATAFQHRSPSFSLLILSGWEDPAHTDRNVTWTRDLFARTHQPFPCAGELGIGHCQLEPERRWLGVDAVAPADGQRVLVFEGARELWIPLDRETAARIHTATAPAVSPETKPRPISPIRFSPMKTRPAST